VVGESEHRVVELLDAAERFVAGAPDIELLDVKTAWLESEGETSEGVLGPPGRGSGVDQW
jgi:hypothetical protein